MEHSHIHPRKALQNFGDRVIQLLPVMFLRYLDEEMFLKLLHKFQIRSDKTLATFFVGWIEFHLFLECKNRGAETQATIVVHLKLDLFENSSQFVGS